MYRGMKTIIIDLNKAFVTIIDLKNGLELYELKK